MYALILTKMGWAIFLAIFSQTHLVTLKIYILEMHIHTYRGIVAQVIQSITTFFFRRQFSVLLAFVLSWSVVMIFIFFSPKNMAFLTKNIGCLCTYGKMILTFVIKKRQFFRRKWAKIAKISDHNIDPRLFVYKLVMQVM
jgi:hypothetical protein